MQDKLEKIKSLTKCGIHLTINQHRNYYETAKESINLMQLEDKLDFVGGQETIDKCIELDTIICLQIYPNTPVGSFVLYHYDLDTILQYACDLYEK